MTSDNKAPQHLWAWVAEGQDSFCAGFDPIGGMWHPLIVARAENVEHLQRLGREMAREVGHRLYLIRFDRAEVIEEAAPHDA